MADNLEPFLTYDVRTAITLHMLEDREVEVCGMITLSPNGEYSYSRAENIADDPTDAIKFTKAASTAIQADDSVVAYVHSHPNGPANPSKMDMEYQALVGKPSVIAAINGTNGVIEVFSFGDHLLDLPLNEREFRYGVTDCYEAVRSWWWQNHGKRMDPFPRHNGWWNIEGAVDLDPKELDMYSQYYATQGYRPFTPNLSDPSHPLHPRIGDAVLMQAGSSMGVPNHAAIYIGNNLIYHHRLGRKSGNTPLGYCIGTGMIRQWLRMEEE